MREYADLHVHMSDLDFAKGRCLLDILAEMGVKQAALQSLTYRSEIYNLWLLYWKQHYSRMELSVFGMVHNQGPYREIPFEQQAKALLDMGCDGIKMMFDPHSRKELGYGLDDACHDRMFDLLEQTRTPVLIHVNDPDSMWVKREPTEYELQRNWCYFLEGYQSKQAIYDETFAMLDKHPNLKVTFAHFFFLGFDLAEARRVMDKYPNVNFDLTPNQSMYVGFTQDIDAWQQFFETYADRIFFGTDSNDTKEFNAEIHLLVRMALTYPKELFKLPCYGGFMVKGLDLSEQALEKICTQNYEDWIGTPKPVDPELWHSAARYVLQDEKSLPEPTVEILRQLTERM